MCLLIAKEPVRDAKPVMRFSYGFAIACSRPILDIRIWCGRARPDPNLWSCPVDKTFHDVVLQSFPNEVRHWCLTLMSLVISRYAWLTKFRRAPVKQVDYAHAAPRSVKWSLTPNTSEKADVATLTLISTASTFDLKRPKAARHCRSTWTKC